MAHIGFDPAHPERSPGVGKAAAGAGWARGCRHCQSVMYWYVMPDGMLPYHRLCRSTARHLMQMGNMLLQAVMAPPAAPAHAPRPCGKGSRAAEFAVRARTDAGGHANGNGSHAANGNGAHGNGNGAGDREALLARIAHLESLLKAQRT